MFAPSQDVLKYFVHLDQGHTPQGRLDVSLSVTESANKEEQNRDPELLMELQADVLLVISCLCEMSMHSKVHIHVHTFSTLFLNISVWHV